MSFKSHNLFNTLNKPFHQNAKVQRSAFYLIQTSGRGSQALEFFFNSFFTHYYIRERRYIGLGLSKRLFWLMF